MNTTDLRAALVELAQPQNRSIAGPRAAVRTRVRRRRVVGGVAFSAVLAIAVAGIVSVARVDDRDETRVEASATTVHDEQHGFSIVLPPGWKQEATLGRQLLAVGFEHAEHPEVTRRQFEELQPLQSRRLDLQRQLQTTPPESADAARIHSQLGALVQTEVEIRSRTGDLQQVEQQRDQLVQQLADASTSPPDRELIQQQMDALTQAEADIRSLPANRCPVPQVTTGISVALVEGAFEMPGAPPVVPRPARFERDDGNGSMADPSWPPCSPRHQTIRFTDAGRELTATMVVAPGVSPARVDEAYAILDSLRFTAEESPSTARS
jgi:hypothetical protein